MIQHQTTNSNIPETQNDSSPLQARAMDSIVGGASMPPPSFGFKTDTKQPSDSGCNEKDAVAQRKLVLEGEQANIDRAVSLLNRYLFGYDCKVDENGNLTIEPNQLVGPPTRSQQAMYRQLALIIQDAKTTTIDVQSDSEEILVGSYNLGAIDISDIEQMASSQGSTDKGAMIHELVEQYFKQVHGEGYTVGGDESTGAHGNGISAENEVNQTVRGAHTLISNTNNPDGSVTAVVDVPYTRPDGSKVVSRLTITNNNVVSVVDSIKK